MANINQFCEEHPDKIFTILSLDELKLCPIVFDTPSTTNTYLTNIGICKFFDTNNGKLYTVYIEVISHQLGTKCKLVSCRSGLCSGIDKSTYCTTCNGTRQHGYLEQLYPATTQIKTSDLHIFEVTNYMIKEDLLEHQIEFFKEKLAAIEQLFTFMRMHSMYASIDDAKIQLSKLYKQYDLEHHMNINTLKLELAKKRNELLQISIDCMEKAEINFPAGTENLLNEIRNLETTIKNLEDPIKS